MPRKSAATRAKARILSNITHASPAFHVPTRSLNGIRLRGGAWYHDAWNGIKDAGKTIGKIGMAVAPALAAPILGRLGGMAADSMFGKKGSGRRKPKTRRATKRKF